MLLADAGVLVANVRKGRERAAQRELEPVSWSNSASHREEKLRARSTALKKHQGKKGLNGALESG